MRSAPGVSMHKLQQPVMVELEEGTGRTRIPSRVLWAGRDLEVQVAGTPWTGWAGGMMQYIVPVMCGGVEYTLALDTATWTWTITR